MKYDPEPIPSWAALSFWETGENQVIQERLADLDAKKIVWNPGQKNLYRALELCPYEKCKVIIIGQDPYPHPNNATGVAFSIKKTSKVMPPTARLILHELRTDMGIGAYHGNLERWCEQGVLLWNAVPTCLALKTGSHYWPEYELLTKEILQRKSLDGIVIRFWGAKAKEYMKYADATESDVDWVGHPSPCGANSARPFLKSRSFSHINIALKKMGHEVIDWRLDEPVSKTVTSTSEVKLLPTTVSPG
jgi:uracil-DNA glycosylase